MSNKNSPRNFSQNRNNNIKGIKFGKNRQNSKFNQQDQFRQSRSSSITNNIQIRSLNQTTSVAAILNNHQK